MEATPGTSNDAIEASVAPSFEFPVGVCVILTEVPVSTVPTPNKTVPVACKCPKYKAASGLL